MAGQSESEKKISEFATILTRTQEGTDLQRTRANAKKGKKVKPSLTSMFKSFLSSLIPRDDYKSGDEPFTSR